MSKLEKTNLALVVPHTHWDREWRYTLWSNRMKLVTFMDNLLDMLDSDDSYRSFLLDGQSVLIEDYLEVAPRQRHRLMRHIASRRLQAGPWYTLPDLFPVSGESLVRNLLAGKTYCSSLGGYLPIAFTTFGWGQSSQLPQIFSGFGISFIITAKHVSPHRAPDIEFWWESPDGTRVLTSRLGEHARANFFFNTYIPYRFCTWYTSDEYRYQWGSSGVFRSGELDHCNGDFQTFASDADYHPEVLKEALQKSWDAYGETRVPEVRLLLDGSDATSHQPALPQLLKQADEVHPEITFRHGSLQEYVEMVKPKLETMDLEVIRGELRDGPSASASCNALATRIHLKQRNRYAEILLSWQSEPISSLLSMIGFEFPQVLFDKAWNYLMKAHAHDSINGVTQDKTADDTLWRINQAEEIALSICDQAMGYLISRIDTSSYAFDDVFLLVCNLSPQQASSPVHCCIDIPQERRSWEVDLIDSKGTRHQAEINYREEVTAVIDDSEARPRAMDAHRLHVSFIAADIPPYGWEVYQVATTTTCNPKTIWPPQRTSRGNEIGISPWELANEHLYLRANTDGTICIRDLTSGCSYDNLLMMEDAGDAGDYWVYYPVYGGPILTSRGIYAETALEVNNSVAATLRISIMMNVPRQAHYTRNELTSEAVRSKETVTVPITHRITLVKGESFVRIQTSVENTARDHRMRLLLPTGSDAAYSYASSHFSMEQRSIKPEGIPENIDTYWPEMQTHPMQHCVDVSDGTRGLAVISSSFTEYEVLRDDDHTLALTLFRGVRNKICSEFRAYSWYSRQHGGQLLGELTYSYAIYPHQGTWQEAEVLQQARKFLSALKVYQFTPGRSGNLPLNGSLCSVKPSCIELSCIKPSEDRKGYIIRLWNPGSQKSCCRVRLQAPIVSAWLCRLDEQLLESLPVEADGRSICCSANAHAIVSLYVTVKQLQGEDI